MLRERIGGWPTQPHDREEIGRFLRHAFPLGLASFQGLIEDQEMGDPELGAYARFLSEDRCEH